MPDDAKQPAPEPEFPRDEAPEVPPGRDPETGDTGGDREPFEQPPK
jgi:hypothetical protein